MNDRRGPGWRPFPLAGLLATTLARGLAAWLGLIWLVASLVLDIVGGVWPRRRRHDGRPRSST